MKKVQKGKFRRHSIPKFIFKDIHTNTIGFRCQCQPSKSKPTSLINICFTINSTEKPSPFEINSATLRPNDVALELHRRVSSERRAPLMNPSVVRHGHSKGAKGRVWRASERRPPPPLLPLTRAKRERAQNARHGVARIIYTHTHTNYTHSLLCVSARMRSHAHPSLPC